MTSYQHLQENTSGKCRRKSVKTKGVITASLIAPQCVPPAPNNNGNDDDVGVVVVVDDDDPGFEPRRAIVPILHCN